MGARGIADALIILCSKVNELKSIYRKITWAVMLCSAFVSIFFVYQPTKLFGMTCFGAIILLSVTMIGLGLRTIQILPGKIPLKYFFSGLFVVIGGACFDVAVTVTYSPDLALEANPFVRFFISIGMPIKQVYLVGLFGQIIYAILILIYWAVFLKAYPLMIKNIQPCGIVNTFVKMYGGVNATKLDLFLNRVDTFYCTNSFIPIIVALSFYRWYLALEWLGWVPISRVVAPIIISLLGFFGYTVFSHRAIEKKVVLYS